MKILLTVPIFELARGGAENFAFRLCSKLAERGHQIHVVTGRGESIPGIEVYRPLSLIDETAKRIRPDLSIDWGFNHPADLHRIGGGVHRFFLEHSLNAYRGPLRLYKRFRNSSIKNRKIIRRQSEMIMRRGAFFVANSRFSASQITGAGAPTENVFVLHNGVDTSLFSPALRTTEPDALRASWGLERSNIAFLFVAHNLVLKNFKLLKEVFERLAKLSKRARLVVAGKHRPARMPGNCIYAGEIYDMPLCYRACDCLVHPTFFDSCANVVFESMSTGLPAVVSNVCGADELVENEKSGFTLPVTGNEREIIEIWFDKIHLLSENKEMRKGMGHSARKAMLGNEFEGYVTRLEAIIEMVIERKAGHGR